MQLNHPPRTGVNAWLAAIAALAVLFFTPAPAAADFSYEVIPGDTLWDIAVKYDISLVDLLEANNLGEDDILSVGRTLTIPGEYDFDYTLTVEHRVKAGECLSLIADEYGVSVDAIRAFNGLDAFAVIYVDQVLTIPPRDECEALAEPEPDIYTVVPGDSAWLIARKFDVPAGALLKHNGLTEDSVLTVGQRLRIPPGSARPPERGLNLVPYTVRPGDCLSIIAGKHDTSVASLCEINGLNSEAYLHPGQILKVPARPEAPQSDKPAQKRPPLVVNPDPLEYDGGPLPPLNVPPLNSAAGEAMRDDSSVFDFTSRQEEFSINGYFDGEHTYYRIERGDCISYIADCFGVTIDEICEASNLTDVDYIIPGQIIKLPGKQDISGIRVYKKEHTNAAGERFVEKCLEYLGLEYVYGGESLSSGVDCSGLVWAIVKRDHGISLPRSAKDLSETEYGIEVSYDALQAGDLVFFHTTRPGISHVGVYMRDGKFVHASSAKDEVVIGRMDRGYYKERFIKALRLNFL